MTGVELRGMSANTEVEWESEVAGERNIEEGDSVGKPLEEEAGDHRY